MKSFEEAGKRWQIKGQRHGQQHEQFTILNVERKEKRLLLMEFKFKLVCVDLIV